LPTVATRPRGHFATAAALGHWSAAETIGDDTLQRETQGRVVPDSFTHGTSAQRMAALRTGLQTDNPDACKL
jgi:predicted metalloprotease